MQPIGLVAEGVEDDSEVRVCERVVVVGLGMAWREAVKWELVMLSWVLPAGLVTGVTDYVSCLVRLELCDVRLASAPLRESSGRSSDQSREFVGGSALAITAWSRSCKVRLNPLCSFIFAWLGGRDRKNEDATSPMFLCYAFFRHVASRLYLNGSCANVGSWVISTRVPNLHLD